MKVYELMEALARYPAGAEVLCYWENTEHRLEIDRMDEDDITALHRDDTAKGCSLNLHPQDPRDIRDYLLANTEEVE